MTLAAGSKLGPYEILAPIGAGGMGEVYRARDTRLDRIVAVKVSGAEFGERFEREARAVAALNHPHICTLYDVGPNYLVMEYIDGAPLKGPMPLEQVFKYAAQICDALDAAHRKGIVHRDLKPPNILVTKAGVKLLDFGLAKLSRDREGAVGGATETIALTREHTILGTLPYMSPEQLEAKDADARSDIFAFGAVLYEMVTGKRAFAGESYASVTAAIMTGQTPPLSTVAPSAPRPLERVVAKCLAKDPDARWQSARDLKDELEWIAGGGAPAVAVAVAPARKPWREYTAWALAAILLGTLAYVYWRPNPATEITRFTIDPPEKTAFAGSLTATVPAPSLAISPDGREVVFAASQAGARPMLWLRRMDEPVSHPLPGTENAQDPFWSPDSRWVAFFSSGKLRKVPAAGGPVQVITEDVGDSRGGSWGADDNIFFSSGNGPIYKIASSGGKIGAVTSLEAASEEKSHRWPHLLPDGRHIFFTVRGSQAANGIYVGSVDGKLRKQLLRLDSSALYAAPGYLLFLDNDKLLGQPFDARRLELTGQPFTIAERVGHSTYGYISVSVSQTGTLAYAGAEAHHERPTWFDREGKALESIGEEGDYIDFRLSPDETRLAFSMVNTKRGFPDIWLTDLTRRSTSLFESMTMVNAEPIWSPEGSRLAFRSSRNGIIEVFQKSAAGGGKDEVLLNDKTQREVHPGSINAIPTDWSTDAKSIAYTVTAKQSGYDVWLLSVEDKRPAAFLSTSADEMHGNFSPDGRLFAYTSNETGKFEVYVQTIPRSDRQWQVSNSGGSEPRWRSDGREIYYLSEDRKLMAVPVGAGPSFGVPKPLFQTRVSMGVMALRTNYVPTRDGQRFLVTTQSGEAPPAPLTVVLNWAAGLKP